MRLAGLPLAERETPGNRHAGSAFRPWWSALRLRSDRSGCRYRQSVGLLRENVGLPCQSVGLLRESVGLFYQNVGLLGESVGLLRESVGLFYQNVGLLGESVG